MEDLVNKLRCYADDLHSAGGFNGYASAMSLAADEIVELREANEAFAKRQEWWGKRMFELEHELLAEREACAAICDEEAKWSSGVGDLNGAGAAVECGYKIRARGGE